MADETQQDPQEGTPKLGVKEFAAKIKAKYPDYAGIDDSTLVQKIITKYPEYKDQIDFSQKKNSLPTSQPSSTVSAPSQSPSVSVAQSTPKGTQPQSAKPQPFDPNTFMRQSRANVLQQPAQDNTLAVQPSQTKTAIDSQLGKEDYQKRKAEISKEAVVNSTAQYLKNKGINAPVGSVQFNQQLAKTQDLVNSGQATVAINPDGQIGLKRVTGFLENIKNGWNEATKSAEEANDFTNNMTTQQRVDYVKSHDIPQPDQFIGEQPSTLGSLAHFAGGAAPFLGKAAVGAGIGALAVAGAPESMGASLAGLPTALSFILTAPDMANQGAQQEIIRRYQILKSQNPDMSDVDAMEEAGKGALAGGIGGILTNAALMGTGLKTPLSLEAKGVVGKTLQEVGKSALHMGGVSAGVTAAQQLEGEAEGIHTSTSDKLKAIEDSFKENATTGAMLTALMHGVPKIMESAIKYSLKDTPPEQIRNVLQANENAGTVPEGTTEKVMKDISSYNDALNKTVDGLTPEATASVAGLIQKKNSLIEESKTKDDSFKPVYKEKIDAIDRQIQDIQRTGKPFEHEIDEVTGKPYQQPTYDDVAQQQVQDLAQKIAKGKQVTDPQDLQTQSNFPKELEAELTNISKKEIRANTNKVNPNTDIIDNINKYKTESRSGAEKAEEPAPVRAADKPAEPVSSPVISDKEKEDNSHAQNIKDKFRETFKAKGNSDEHIDAAIALMDARAKSWASEEKGRIPEQWYQQIADVKNGEFQTEDVKYQGGKLKAALLGAAVMAHPLETKELKPNETTNITKTETIDVNNKPTIKISDNRNIDEVSGKAVTDRNNLTEKNVDVPTIKEIVREANKRGIDPYTALAIAYQETHISSDYADNPMRVRFDQKEDTSKTPIQQGMDILKEKLDIGNKLGGETEAGKLQAYNGYGKIGKSTEGKQKSLYGIDVSKKDIDTKVNPVYGKRIIDIRDNILKKNPELVKLVESERKNIAFQQENGIKHGALETLKDGSVIIHALDAPDVSTMVHEIFHVFEKDLTDSERKQVEDFGGSEAFARAGERYLRDGNAPSKELQPLFEKFKQWLTNIYQSLKGSPISKKISPEIKNIFDRLLTEPTEEQPSSKPTNTEENNSSNQLVTGKEIEPHKEVKANKSLAQKEVAGKYDLKPMEASMLHSLKDKDVNQEYEASEGLKKAMYDKLYEKGFIGLDDGNNYTLSEKGNDFIKAVDARYDTRKNVKAGTDLFPEDANIPELKSIKKELKNSIDDNTIQHFEQRPADEVEKSEPTIKDIESKASSDNEAELTEAIRQADELIGNGFAKDKPEPNEGEPENVKEQVKEQPVDPEYPDYKPLDFTAIKNDVVNSEREAQGKEPLKSSGDGTMTRAEQTKAKIESGEISEEHIRDLTQAIATGDKDFVTNLKPDEIQHVLLFDRQTLQNKRSQIESELIAAKESKNDAAVERVLIKQAQNDLLLEANDKAANKTGREWSDAGRARQLLIRNDYSFEALKRRAKAASKDGVLDKASEDRLRELSKLVEQKDAQLLEKNEAIAAADREIAILRELNKAAKEKSGHRKSEVTAFDDLRKETKNQIRQQGRRTIEKIKHERENIKANLKSKWKNHVHGGNMGVNNLIPLDMVPDLIKLAKSYIEETLAVGKEAVLEHIIDRVHKDVVEAIGDVDKTTVRDAITGYGKIKKPNTDPIDTAFRDIAAQGRLVSSIELAEKGEPPLKSGQQRDKPTAEQRRLQKELNKAIKDNNIQVKSPEEQLKTSLDAAKTRLKNQIEDLSDAIDRNEKIVKDRKGLEYDQEANDLKAQRDELRDEYDKIFGTDKELTTEERIERASKAVQKSIEKLNERIANKDFSQSKKADLKSPELDTLKKQREDLQKVYKDLMDAEGETNRRKLEALKKHIAKRTAYLNEIKNTGNLDKFIADRTKKKTVLDAEATRMKAEQQKVKNDVDNMIRAREFQNMSSFQKGLHWAGRFSKGVLISNPAVLMRIVGSVIGRATMKAPTATVTYGLSKILPSLAKGAHTEAITSAKDLAGHLATYYSTLFSKENFEGMKFAFKHHNTAEDLTLGRNFHKLPIPDIKVTNLKTAIQASFFNTLKVLDKNASLHGAGKSLASLPEYRAYQKTIAVNLIREGITAEELGQPTLQEAINQLAFRKSLRAKFMQDNTVTGMQGTLEEYFRRKKMPELAEVLNGILPITKISSNYISEALTKIPFVGNLAAYKPISKILAHAFGDPKLSEQEKSILLRTLTYQGVGALTYALGWALHGSFSPFYKSSANKFAQKKNPDEEDNSLLVLFETLSHFPDALVFNAGVSHAWVWDKYDEEHPGEKSMATFMGSMPDAIMENSRNIASSSPYLSTGNTVLNPLITGKGTGKAAANFVKSRIPFSTTLSEVAQGKIPVLNKLGIKSGHEEEVKPYEVGLYPKTFMDNIGIGVPGWRQKILQRLYDEKYNTEKPEKTDAELDAEDERADKLDQDKEKFEEQLRK